MTAYLDIKDKNQHWDSYADWVESHPEFQELRKNGPWPYVTTKFIEKFGGEYVFDELFLTGIQFNSEEELVFFKLRFS